MLHTPASLEEEHKEIMGFLRKFSRAFDDETGSSLKELLTVLEPHFKKENQIAMPVLGSLSTLVYERKRSSLIQVSKTRAPFEEEYKNMLEEHAQLKKLISTCIRAAKHEKHNEVVDLLYGLAHHARIEEEVLYPAALLAGTYANLMLSKE